MSALIEAGHLPGSTYEVVLVLSNRPDAPGLDRARSAGIKSLAIDHSLYGKDRVSHERALHKELEGADVEVVALAGYMRLLTPWLVQKWAGRLLNIHPSLLPLYPGLDTHARALAAGDTHGGCTVHLVSEGVDEGQILAQRPVSIQVGDTHKTLAARVLDIEHRLYPEVLTNFCRNLA